MSEAKRLRREPDEAVLGGVCAGVARFADVDRTLVRALCVLFTVLTAVVPGTIAYLALWAFLPSASADTGPGVRRPEQG